jgi:hydroxymethylglutaryl-CoA lyase
VVREVGLRDGLQLVKSWPSTDAKRRWIEADYKAGLRHFEAGSYLPSASFPQFADVDDVVGCVKSMAGAFSSVLVLNKRGALRALEGQADEITCVISASEAHNLANARKSRDEGLREIAEIVALRDASSRRPLIGVGIAMSFGCSIAGDIALDDVVRVAERCVEAGVDVVGIADTVGYGGPAQVRSVVRALRPVVGERPLLMHFHDTRGTGIANVAAALDEGVRAFDASLGGLGGCPFAPAATGNVVLEDVLYLAQSMGFDVPVNLDALMEARSVLAKAMPNEPLNGQLARAGLPIGRLTQGAA